MTMSAHVILNGLTGINLQKIWLENFFKNKEENKNDDEEEDCDDCDDEDIPTTGEAVQMVSIL